MDMICSLIICITTISIVSFTCSPPVVVKYLAQVMTTCHKDQTRLILTLRWRLMVLVMLRLHQLVVAEDVVKAGDADVAEGVVVAGDADVAGDVQAMDSWCWNQAGCERKMLLLQLYTTSQSQLDRLTDFRQTVRQLYSSIRCLATTSLFSWQSQRTSTQLRSHHHRKMQHMGSTIHLMSTGMRQLLMK